MPLTIFAKKYFRKTIKQGVKNVETCNFCKGVLVKNLNFFHISILGKIGPENEFHDILKRKRCLFRLKKQEV